MQAAGFHKGHLTKSTKALNHGFQTDLEISKQLHSQRKKFFILFVFRIMTLDASKEILVLMLMFIRSTCILVIKPILTTGKDDRFVGSVSIFIRMVGR